MVEAPGVAPVQQRFQDSARNRAFLVKVLTEENFDGFHQFPCALFLYPAIDPICGGTLEAMGARRRRRQSRKTLL